MNKEYFKKRIEKKKFLDRESHLILKKDLVRLTSKDTSKNAFNLCGEVKERATVFLEGGGVQCDTIMSKKIGKREKINFYNMAIL